jgi:alpha-ribazole phosphatase
MARILLIRHGKTQGNLERRYLGDPNEPLCAEGIQALEELAASGVLPSVAALYAAPALRCRRTAELLFSGTPMIGCPMREIDFGVFKGKNAGDLLGSEDYERWLDTGCMGDIPGGESVTAFKARCCETFESIAEAHKEGITALILHGGNIMAILERLGRPKRDFYDYHVPNGGFFLCRRDNGTLTVEKKRP